MSIVFQKGTTLFRFYATEAKWPPPPAQV